jgi:quinol monooxygenase YgiN
MISLIVRMKFPPEDKDEVTELLLRLTEASRREPGCVSFVPHRLEGDPDTVLIYEQYKDAAAADSHRQSEHFKSYAVCGLYQKMLERQREDLEAIE